MKRSIDGAYTPVIVPDALWSGGEQISIRVQGNQEDPPPFNVLLTAPDLPTLTEPSDSTVVDVTRDLAFAWTGAASGYVLVFSVRRPDQDAYVSCRWVAPDGSRAVPASLLSGLAAGPTSFFVRIEGPPVGALGGDWTFSASATMDVAHFDLTLQ